MNLLDEIKYYQSKIPKEYHKKYFDAFESFFREIVKSEEIMKIVNTATYRITQSVNEDIEIIGKILRYHLEMESIMNEYIQYHYCDTMNLNILINLSFYKKTALIKNVPYFEKELKMIVDGLIELNNLRNKLAHDTNFNVMSFKAVKMNAIIDKLKEQKELLAPTINLNELNLINTVRFFCLFSVGMLFIFYGKSDEYLVNSFKQFVNDFLISIDNKS